MSNGAYVPPRVVRFVTALLAIAAILGFIAVSLYAFVKTFQAKSQPPVLNDAYLYVTATLSSLVGGIVAVAFGQKPPDQTERVGGAGDNVRRNLTALTQFTTGTEDRSGIPIGAVVGSAYAICYVALGLAAIAIWVSKAPVAADPVKALAATFIGLALPIVRAFFRPVP